MKKMLLACILLSILLTGCASKKSDTSNPSVNGASTVSQKEKIPFDIVKDGYFKGAKDPKVTIVEFSDFQCPACGQMSGVMNTLVDNFPNDVKLVYRHFPLSYHEFSKKAAYATEAAGAQGKFWEMHDLLFANQTKLSNDIFDKFAIDLGLNMDQFNKDINSDAIKNKVDRDISEGGNTLGIGGTPTFYFNNVEYTGDYSLKAITDEVNRLITQ
jgi:protein-disulfide isomerase